ncbi:uncharacterized protein LTR77_007919 [Saxophila tyrrhenica]|uniref:Signal recognition particle receptor subunit beta n=1 Tax=Saxophila tyrrhenica TaxID=1690608 RepID=A0AAV9P7F4_9PEZI|nr:hypothetical protein LTR77_007919 [Saxophila tyrrhenica]
MASQSTVEAWLTWAFSPSISAILVTLVISLLSPILIHIYLYRKAQSKELPSFLLLGPSGAGKTTLLTLFANGTPSTTHTSQEPQTALCRLPSTVRSSEDRYRSEHDTSSRSQPQFLLVDTPGHGKLRHHAVTSLTSPGSLKGLIFVVDSAATSSSAGLTAAAEYLYDILLILQKRHTHSKTSKDPTALPVLIAANKQDVFTSLPTGLVKSKLEEEIARVRQTRSKGLLDSGIGMEDANVGDEEGNWLGEYGAREFGFGQMEEHGVDVRVAGGNVRGEGEGEGRVEEWWGWVGENL